MTSVCRWDCDDEYITIMNIRKRRMKMSDIKMIVAGVIVLTAIRYAVLGTIDILSTSDTFTCNAVEITLKIVSMIFM